MYYLREDETISRSNLNKLLDHLFNQEPFFISLQKRRTAFVENEAEEPV